MSAVDIALWDLRARRQGAPLWRVLGGFDPRVPCYAGGIDLDFSLEALLRQTDENLARGFRAIKMKVGRPSLRADVERVRAMRAHLGPEFPLMVDANMRWSVDEAIRAARALAESAPLWLEEPTIPDDVPGHARIVHEGGLPIAAGENLHTLYEFRQLIAAGGVTFPEPDVTNCGGVTAFMKVCHLAEAFNLPVTSTSWRRHRIVRTWRPTASAWTGTSPSPSGSRRASPSRRCSPATASSSTGRRSKRSGRSEPRPADQVPGLPSPRYQVPAPRQTCGRSLIRSGCRSSLATRVGGGTEVECDSPEVGWRSSADVGTFYQSSLVAGARSAPVGCSCFRGVGS